MPLSDTLKSRARKFANLAFPAAAILFVIWFMTAHTGELELLVTTADPFRLLISFALMAVFVAIQACIGALVLETTGCETPFHETYPAILLSLLGKYIPGKVWVLTMRFSSLSKKSATITNIIAGSAVEHVFVIATGLMIFLMTATSAGALVSPILVTITLISYLLFAFHPRKVLALVNLSLKRIGRSPIERWPNRKENIMYSFGYICTWFILGSSIYFLTSGLVPSLPASAYAPLTGAYALSVIAGFLAIFAPGGIGVREGLFAIALKGYMPTVQAVYVTIAVRMVFTAAELCTIGLIVGTIAALKKKGLLGRPEQWGRP